MMEKVNLKIEHINESLLLPNIIGKRRCLYLFLNIGLKAVKGFIAYSNKFSYNRRTVYLGGP